MDQKRCFGCLRTGHSSKLCQNRHTCQRCKGRHPTCLHDSNFVPKAIQPTAENATKATGSSAATLNTTEFQSEPSTTSTVVPVWVSTSENSRKEKLVYALLDTQSNISFVDEQLRTSLNSQTEPVNLKLTTMTNKEANTQCGRVSSLKLRGYSSDITIEVPAAYTKQVIPLDYSQVPTKETARKWKHLKVIAEEIPPLLDIDAGLLIGYNVSQALAPREVITGNDDEPFAVKMDLGWSVVGRGSPSATMFSIIGACRRVMAEETPPVTPRDALKLLERDFKDMEVGGKTVSQDDLHFLEIVEGGISKDEEDHLQMPLPFREHPTLLITDILQRFVSSS